MNINNSPSLKYFSVLCHENKGYLLEKKESLFGTRYRLLMNWNIRFAPLYLFECVLIPWAYYFFFHPRPDSDWDSNRFTPNPNLVPLYQLIISRVNLEFATKSFSISRSKWCKFTVMSHLKVCPYSYLWWFGYSWCPWVSHVMSSQSGLQKYLSISWTHSLPFCFLFHCLTWFNAFITKGM